MLLAWVSPAFEFARHVGMSAWNLRYSYDDLKEKDS